MHGTRTWGGNMEGTDESTELWLYPILFNSLVPNVKSGCGSFIGVKESEDLR